MKTILVFLLVFTMLVSLVACGEESDVFENDESYKSVESSDTSSGEYGNTTDKGSDNKNHNVKLDDFDTTATVEETVIFENENVKITVNELSYERRAAILELTFENNTDKDLTFLCGTYGYCCNSVNGYMTGFGYISCDVVAGKKGIDTLRFEYDELRVFGINEIADIELGFSIHDDEYNYEYTGPLQIKTSLYDDYDHTKNAFQLNIDSDALKNTLEYETLHFSTDSVYEENGIRHLSSAVIKNDDETILLLEIENVTNEMFKIAASNIYLNDLLVDYSHYESYTINPGKRAIVNIVASDALAEDYWYVYGIEDIGSFGVSLNLRDMDGEDISKEKSIEIEFDKNAVLFDTSGVELYKDDDIRIIQKTIVENPSEYSSDINVFLLVENTAEETLKVTDVSRSLSINDLMSDYNFYSTKVAAGKYALVKINISESNLEKNKIESVEDIETIELDIKIRNEKNTIKENTTTICISNS